MKVIFLEDVAGTADAGDVKVVKNGFARNFLLPRNLAAPATPDQLQRLHAIQKTAQEKRLKFSEELSLGVLLFLEKLQYLPVSYSL